MMVFGTRLKGFRKLYWSSNSFSRHWKLKGDITIHVRTIALALSRAWQEITIPDSENASNVRLGLTSKVSTSYKYYIYFMA